MDNPFFNKFMRGTTPTLLKIAHNDLPEPLYLTNNKEALTFEGNEYKPFMFRLPLPDTTSESMGNAKLTISVVNRELIRILRGLKPAPTIIFTATYQEDKQTFTTLERSAMTFGSVDWGASQMEAELVLDTLLLYEIPSGKFTPVSTPGIA